MNAIHKGIRKPTAPPSVKHSGKKGDKGYSRKTKHKEKQHG